MCWSGGDEATVTVSGAAYTAVLTAAGPEGDLGHASGVYVTAPSASVGSAYVISPTGAVVGARTDGTDFVLSSMSTETASFSDVVTQTEGRLRPDRARGAFELRVLRGGQVIAHRQVLP